MAGRERPSGMTAAELLARLAKDEEFQAAAAERRELWSRVHDDFVMARLTVALCVVEIA